MAETAALEGSWAPPKWLIAASSAYERTISAANGWCLLKGTSYGKALPGATGPPAFLLGETPFRWLNGVVKPDVFTPDTLPALPAGRARYGVLGQPVAHSLSPQMHQAGFAALGVDAEYLRVEVEARNLAAVVPRLPQVGFRGWNCTLPHKNTMFTLVDHLDSTATEAKSVNTVRIDKGKLRGFSTDAMGWRAAVQEAWKIDLTKCRILILGCGGVGQTLARHLAKLGCLSLTLVNREPSKAQKLVEELGSVVGNRFPLLQVAWQSQDLASSLRETDLLIQGTSLGLQADDPLPVDPSQLPRNAKIYDTVYRRDLTPFVQRAHELSLQAEDGLGMLLHQGALSFSIWTGQPAPIEKMRQALYEAAGRSP